MGVEDFLLGRNFLRTYQVLVDLTAMNSDPSASKDRVASPHTQVGDSNTAIQITLAPVVVLQPSERMIAGAAVVN